MSPYIRQYLANDKVFNYFCILCTQWKVSDNFAKNFVLLTFTRSWISSKSVAFTTSTAIRARNIFANSHTKFVRFVNFTFVDIVTCSIVGIQFETRVATASITSPIINATVLAESWIFLAFVHIHAFPIIIWIIVKAIFAVATVGSDRIYAFSVRRTRSAIFIKFTFVDILAITIIWDKSRRTHA